MSSEDPFIPEIVQSIIRDLASRCDGFSGAASEGGSWAEIHVWLVSMQPSFEALLEVGMDDIRRTARMPIPPDKQDEITASFIVPDTVPPPESEHDFGYYPEN